MNSTPSSSPSSFLGTDWFEKCANYLNDAILITEAEPIDLPGPIIVWANDVFYKQTGYEPHEVIGQSPRILQGPLSDRSALARLRDALERWEVCRIEILNYKKDGTTFWNEFEVTPIADENGWYTHWIAVQRDVTERKNAEAKLIYQSSHDELTGLVNRREFERRAELLLMSAATENITHTLCYIDLDQFKVVNDTCGHVAGDELLRQLGGKLSKLVRRGDTLARLGGDEFGVLIKNIGIDDATTLAASIRSAIEDFQYSYQAHSFRISASIGLVPIVDAQTPLTELLKNADAACYLAKDYGRNRIHVYSSNDEELSQRHGEMQWVTRIQHALSENRFCLYAQSIESLRGSDKVHYELLIRMKDIDGVIIPPGAFLPAAERYNLSVQLDKWVIEETCRLLFLNPSFLDSVDFISVNLSGHSLTDTSVLRFIISKFEQYSFDAQRFCFEITETAAISHIVIAEKFITELKALGCRFALDDFGSGLSSFGYLKSLPVDYLKIDGMFVKDMIEDKVDYAMVKAIDDVGKIMQMQTIAEFVENKSIKDVLSEIGVDYAQGYGIHKPQPFEEIINAECSTRRTT